MSERTPPWPERATALGQAPWIGAVAAAVVALAFAPLFPELLRAWRTDEYAGHGMFVPVYAVALLWMTASVARHSPAERAGGWLVLLVALGLFAAGRSWESLTVQVAALVAAIAGAVLVTFGAAALRAAAFPVAFLLLMMPLPRPVVAAVTLPIQTLAAQFASAVLRLAGVPHYQYGISLDLPNLRLAVAEGCNGLRFLMACHADGSLRPGHPALATPQADPGAAAVPVALVANQVRVRRSPWPASTWGHRRRPG